MGILTREQIEAVDDIKSQMVEFEVPEWGGSVYLRTMTVRELDDYSNAVMRAKGVGLSNFRSQLVANCMCDANGVRLYSNEEVAALAKKNAVVVDRIYRACDNLNDISPKKIEEIAGNSNAGPSESSSSGSPATSSEPLKKSTDSLLPSSECGGLSTDTTNHSEESGSKSGELSQP